MTTTENVMTEGQATDEALLLFIRKMRRLHPDAFAEVIGRLPEGARWALDTAERRADRVRDEYGIGWLDYPMPIEDCETEDSAE